jgi:hypothetical protein
MQEAVLGRDHERAEKFIFVGFREHTDNVVLIAPSTQPLVNLQLEGELGTPSQQSPTEYAAYPDSVENQKMVPSEGEPPAQRESKQEALTADKSENCYIYALTTGLSASILILGCSSGFQQPVEPVAARNGFLRNEGLLSISRLSVCPHDPYFYI